VEGSKVIADHLDGTATARQSLRSVIDGRTLTRARLSPENHRHGPISRFRAREKLRLDSALKDGLVFVLC
jgi:hypothetical protein